MAVLLGGREVDDLVIQLEIQLERERVCVGLGHGGIAGRETAG